MSITLSQIRRDPKQENVYIVAMDAGDDSVKASFEVRVIVRRRGRDGALEHHTQIERLEEDAKDKVLLFLPQVGR